MGTEVEKRVNDLLGCPFQFDLTRRNAALLQTGVKPPSELSSGTTIVGFVFADGVIIGADSRATAGDFIADKRCKKLKKISNYMFSAGAGTAADIHAVARMLRANIKLHELNTGRRAPVVCAARLARQHLYRYQGYVSAYVLIGGVDESGPQLYSVHAHGSVSRDPFIADGSGSLSAMGILDAQYKFGMNQQEAEELMVRALSAGMSGDLMSGNSLNYQVVRTDGKPVEWKQVVPSFCGDPKRELKYRFNPANTVLLDKKEVKFDVVDEKMDTA